VSENLLRIQNALREEKLPGDAVLITSLVNRRFATGFASSAGMVVIAKEKSWFLTDFRYAEAARNALSGTSLLILQRGQKYSTLISDILQAENIKSLGFEDQEMTVAEHAALSSELSSLLSGGLLPIGSRLSHLRASKLPFELKYMRKAQKIAEKAFEQLLSVIAAGMTEKQLEAELMYRLLLNGAEGLSFDPIVVSGPNSALPHGRAGDRVLQAGDFVTMDFGVTYRGYCSDMTRTVAIGYATDEMRKVYNTVLKAQEIGLEKAKAGILWSDVDMAARNYIAAEGYGEYFGHGLGHGLGLLVHESLDFDPDRPGITPVNGVVSVEPGIYLPGKFGVRIEDCVILQADGNENLTSSPKELIIIGK
jgi:Xaa-Pro aminopeptidase